MYYILLQDADLEYDPNDYIDLLAPVLRFDADVVMGSRFAAPKWTRVFYYWHKVGNRILTTWFNVLYNTTWTDVYSGYLMFRRELLKADDLSRMGWDQHAEILGRLCLKRGRFYEVPISYNGRFYDEGKKIHWYNILPVLFTMCRVRIVH